MKFLGCFGLVQFLSTVRLLPVPNSQNVVSTIVNACQWFTAIWKKNDGTSKLESINGNWVLDLTGFGKWKSDYLSLKCMLDNHKCFQCIIIPDSNMRWLTLSACSTSNLATCDQKSIWIWVECQAKNNGINSFSRWLFVLYVMNWYSRHFLNYKLWILSIWIFEFPSS